MIYRRHFSRAAQIFDLEDAHARNQGLKGAHPRPVGPVKLLLVGQVVGATREDFDTPLELVTQVNPSGYHLFFGTVRLPDGDTRRSALDGTYVVRVEGSFYQPVEENVTFPMPNPKQPYSVALHPSFAYPFSNAVALPDGPQDKLPARRGPTLLRGSLHHTNGQPIVNASVHLTDPDIGEDVEYQGDQTGQWVLVLPDDVFPDEVPTDDEVSQQVTLRFEWPDPEEPESTIERTIRDFEVVRGRENKLSQTSLRGWVLTEAGRGIQGAAIEVDGFAEQSTTAEDGGWFYYFDLGEPPETVGTVDVSAVLPDGRRATRSAVPVERGATSVVETFRFP